MKVKPIVVGALATALCLGPASPALAAPLSMAKLAPQVTGTRLQSALLPASAFGDGFAVASRFDTGNVLFPAFALFSPSDLTCSLFQPYALVVGFGNTAGATEIVTNPHPAAGDYPNVVLAAQQGVLQFQTVEAAATFFSQAFSVYKQCSAYTESVGSDNVELELTTQSLSSTTIDANEAFQLIQYVDVASRSATSFYQSTTVVLSGANVYAIDNLDGTNDPIAAWLLGSLIQRVQALYEHH
jgi:hypothetical protein